MLQTKKPPSPLKRSIRNLQLGFSLGVAAFLLGVLISSRLKFALLGELGKIESDFVYVLANDLIKELPTLVAAPLIAYVIGLYLEGPRWTLAWSMVVGTQAFPVALGWMVAEGQLTPMRIAIVVASSIAGGFLCAWALARAQRTARGKPAAAPATETVAGPLSKIDFEAVKKAVDASEAGGEATDAGSTSETQKPDEQAAPETQAGSEKANTGT